MWNIVLPATGEPVRAGDVVARVHPTTRTGGAPRENREGMDRILAACHFPGLVEPGDSVSLIARIVG